MVCVRAKGVLKSTKNDMNVAELIKELKKMPKHASIAVKAHDNSPGEIQGFVWSVDLTDFDKLPDEMGIKGLVVVLKI